MGRDEWETSDVTELAVFIAFLLAGTAIGWALAELARSWVYGGAS